MQKILLVGELSEIMRSLNECLVNDYQVQLCTEELENVKAMVKIVKPDLIVVCQIGIEEFDGAIYGWIREKHPQMPVLGITTSEDWRRCKGYFDSERFAVLFRPVAKNELLETCRRLLGQGHAAFPVETAVKQAQGKRKIMIVDDSALLLRSMKSMLEKKYDICLAKSGEQALKLIPKEKPDLILLDYEMEGMDGRCTFEAMKKDEEMKWIPVVFLTSIADRKAIYSVLKSKPDGYILKPPDENRIMETIEGILGGDSI